MRKNKDKISVQKKQQVLITQDQRTNNPILNTVYKRIRNLNKKLINIDQLKSLDQTSLKPEQINKIANRNQVQNQIKKNVQFVYFFKGILHQNNSLAPTTTDNSEELIKIATLLATGQFIQGYRNKYQDAVDAPAQYELYQTITNTHQDIQISERINEIGVALSQFLKDPIQYQSLLTYIANNPQIIENKGQKKINEPMKDQKKGQIDKNQQKKQQSKSKENKKEEITKNQLSDEIKISKNQENQSNGKSTTKSMQRVQSPSNAQIKIPQPQPQQPQQQPQQHQQQQQPQQQQPQQAHPQPQQQSIHDQKPNDKFQSKLQQKIIKQTKQPQSKTQQKSPPTPHQQPKQQQHKKQHYRDKKYVNYHNNYHNNYQKHYYKDDTKYHKYNKQDDRDPHHEYRQKYPYPKDPTTKYTNNTKQKNYKQKKQYQMKNHDKYQNENKKNQNQADKGSDTSLQPTPEKNKMQKPKYIRKD